MAIHSVQILAMVVQRLLLHLMRSRLVFTAPASQGAYADIDECLKDPYLDSLLKDLYYKQIYYDDPLRMKTPYEFVSKRPIEPPDGMLFDVIAFVAVTLDYTAS
eukprot:scaffold36341_cov43-Cyclotella_meneghiniana.AAC.11